MRIMLDGEAVCSVCGDVWGTSKRSCRSCGATLHDQEGVDECGQPMHNVEFWGEDGDSAGGAEVAE